MNSRITAANYFDLTQSQSLIWIGQQLNPESPMYNMAFAFRLNGLIDETVFRKAFSILIQQCDVMRTVVEVREDQPQQKILNDFSYDLEILDFSEREDKEAFLKNWTESRSQQGFDLSTGLFDSVLIKMDEACYVWYLNQHHLITDGWSKTIQYKKMAEIYGALRQESEATNLASYKEFIQFEKTKGLASSDTERLDYWNQKIEELPPLPGFYGNANKEGSSDAQRLRLSLSKEKSDQLRTLATESDLRAWTQDLSLFNIFSTLLIASLHRLSGKSNLAIGIPVLNRPSSDFKETVGLFTELFPLSVEVLAKDTFLTLFNKVRDEGFYCLKNAEVACSNKEMSRGFNVVLNYMNGNFGDFNGLPVKVEWVFSGHVDPGHHMRLQIFDFNDSGTIEVYFDLNTEVFDSNQREMVLQQFSQLLDRFIEDRTQLVNQLSKEELAFLATFDKTNVGYPEDKTIIDFFRKQVDQYPNKAAVVFKEKSLTYQQLDQQSNQLAAYLQERGVKEETIVGICLEHSLEMVISILAVVKAGGTYLSIDPEHPKDRINYILADSGLEIMISLSTLSAVLSKENSQCILLDTDQEAIAQELTTAPETNVKANHSAYVIYTSGSTGNPKGVVIEHRSVVRLFFNEEPLFNFNENDIWTLFHSFCFDLSVWEMYGALLFGGTVIIVPKETSKDPEAFATLLRKEEVTVLTQTPGAFYNVQDAYLSKGSQNSIRYIIFAGEALLPTRLKEWKSSYPDCSLINMYGATETTVHATYMEITEKEIASGLSNIGNAIPTFECLLLDENLQQVQLNVPGEIYVGGTGLARAYLNREELTAERFIPHPFKADENARLYKTGDLGLRLSDGSIKYIGRLDNQMKIRGYRVELGEIEASLNNEPSVDQGIALAIDDGLGNKRLVAYVVSKGAFSQSEMKAYLKQKLPAYMVPSLIVNLDAFPLTANGKVDKKALSERELNSSLDDAEFKEASNEFEQIISEIWSDVLQLEQIDVRHDFFDLGGDSLSSIRAMNRINEMLELDLRVNLIFQKSTIADLALEVEETIKRLLMEVDNSQSI